VLDDLLELDVILEVVWAALDLRLLDDNALLIIFDVELDVMIVAVDWAALDLVLLVEAVLDREVVDVEEMVPNR